MKEKSVRVACIMMTACRPTHIYSLTTRGVYSPRLRSSFNPSDEDDGKDDVVTSLVVSGG